MNDKTALITHLLEFITDNKKEKIQQVLEHRTRYLTVILEDLFQPHNASAAMRTCDIFGVQDIHVVEHNYRFKPIDTISMGSSKWVDVHHHASIIDLIAHLKKDGYRIVATSPHRQSYSLPELPLDQKTALLFGSEQMGLSQEALDNADLFVKIPMYGFVESFNVSVSVALCLYDMVTRLHSSEYVWQLSEEERQDLLIKWVCKASKTAEMIVNQNK